MPVSERLAAFRHDYQPKANAFAPDIRELENGAYDFHVIGERMRNYNGTDILELTLQVVGTANEYTNSYWFDNQNALNKLGADLLVLGFDTTQAGQLLKLVDEIEAGRPVLRGMKFRGQKSSRFSEKDKKTYHSLTFLSKLPAAGAGKLAAPPARLEEPGPKDGDIPF